MESPLRLRFVGEAKGVLAADWRDGHVSEYPLAYLRGWCGCAECQGHASEHRFVVVAPESLRLAAITPVGSYAVSLVWSDGHATGIYPFELLRNLCPCAPCGGPRPGTP